MSLAFALLVTCTVSRRPVARPPREAWAVLIAPPAKAAVRLIVAAPPDLRHAPDGDPIAGFDAGWVVVDEGASVAVWVTAPRSGVWELLRELFGRRWSSVEVIGDYRDTGERVQAGGKEWARLRRAPE